MVHPEQVGLPELRDRVENPVQQGLPVLRVLPVPAERVDLPEFKAPMDQVERVVQQESPV